MRSPLHHLETRQGLVLGTREDDLFVLRGLPFAASASGAGRLQPPRPPSVRSAPFDADRFGPAPAQCDDPMVALLGLLGDPEQDEDCLTLNVWSPGFDDAHRPIVVWIHGGAFATGTGSGPIYCGARLAARGDIVVVTLNYRVGALGFLWQPGLVANLGLLDQIAALRFVREHATALGGDPARITVMGESAGAGSLVALLAMPETRGLCGRAVIQSAAPTAMIDRPEAERRAARLCTALGTPAGDNDALRRAPLDAILAAQAECLLEGPHTMDMFFVPVVDGDRLPETPLDAIASGSARDVELVIGTTASEMQLYALATPPASITDELLLERVRAELPRAAERRETTGARDLADGYARARAARGAATTPADLLWAIQSDLRLREPSIRVAESQARHQPATFMYRFDWCSPLQGGLIGSSHALDLPFTFGTLDAPKMDAFAGSGPEAERLAGDWMDAWIAFAHSGDPSHAGIGTWPRYESERRATLCFGPPHRVEDAPGDLERGLIQKIHAIESAPSVVDGIEVKESR